MIEHYSLNGINGNAYCILAYVEKSMKQMKYTESEINNYLTSAKSSDYNNLISISLEMIDELNMKYEEMNNKY